MLLFVGENKFGFIKLCGCATPRNVNFSAGFFFLKFLSASDSKNQRLSLKLDFIFLFILFLSLKLDFFREFFC
jgi:hypothetical protein